MYRAIRTRYIGATKSRNQRVKATTRMGSVTLDWDNDVNDVVNHQRAAEALAAKYKWRGRWHGGHLEDGCVFVNSGDDAPLFVTGEEV